MKNIKTYEGLFDFLKRGQMDKSYQEYYKNIRHFLNTEGDDNIKYIFSEEGFDMDFIENFNYKISYNDGYGQWVYPIIGKNPFGEVVTKFAKPFIQYKVKTSKLNIDNNRLNVVDYIIKKKATEVTFIIEVNLEPTKWVSFINTIPNYPFVPISTKLDGICSTIREIFEFDSYTIISSANFGVGNELKFLIKLKF